MTASSQISDENKDELVITRIIDAPRELVFRAWTDPEHFVKWWGPRNFTTPHCTIDLRVGGQMHFCMRSPDGDDFWAGGVYLDVDPPKRIVCTDYFSDAEGNVVSPTAYGLPEGWPEESIMTITFEEYEGRTKLTMHQTVAESLAKLVQADTGWNQSFDRLEEMFAS